MLCLGISKPASRTHPSSRTPPLPFSSLAAAAALAQPSQARRGVPSSAEEGAAWKTVSEVLGHLRDLEELGDDGPLRELGWSEGMEKGIDGMLDTLGRCAVFWFFS